jgi:hypothetical protein
MAYLRNVTDEQVEALIVKTLEESPANPRLVHSRRPRQRLGRSWAEPVPGEAACVAAFGYDCSFSPSAAWERPDWDRAPMTDRDLRLPRCKPH